MIRTTRRVLWAGVGAVVAYFFDPVTGRARRARLRDQTAARLRELLAAGKRQTRHQAGRMRGRIHQMIASDRAPATDEELLHKIRSEAVGPAPGHFDHVDLKVTDGEVTLVGTSLDHGLEDDLVRRIGEVTGVERVTNQLVRA